MMTNLPITTEVKVADEVFLIAAILHRENPSREEFTISEIVERAEREKIHGQLRPGVRVHATLHCVANRPPNPGRYQMLYATGESTRRLLLSGDDVNPDRIGAKKFPSLEEVPEKYHELIEWAKKRYASRQAQRPRWLGGILELRMLGKELWRGEDPDEYVARLRRDDE
jgi:hypothetical protein